MEKRKHTLSLSFVLLRFVAGMFVTMLLCFMIWSLVMSLLEQKGIICSGSEINHQVEEILGTSSGKFTEPDECFPGEYALYDAKGTILKTNVEREIAEDQKKFSYVSGYAAHLSRRTYADGSTALLRWHFRKEFTDPLRSAVCCRLFHCKLLQFISVYFPMHLHSKYIFIVKFHLEFVNKGNMKFL